MERWRFTREFKLEVVKLVTERGVTYRTRDDASRRVVKVSVSHRRALESACRRIVA